MATMGVFKQVHRANTDRLKQYQTRRGIAVRLDRAVMDEFDERGDYQLLSNNPDARIRFATILTQHLRRFLSRADDTEFQWVTLCPVKYARPLDKAANFDPRTIIGWAHQAIRGFNYIGMVEASLYGNYGDDRRQKFVSWHVHLIVWGAPAATINAVIRQINKTTKSLIPGIAPAYAEPVANQDVLGKAFYMSKSPRSESRIYPKRKTDIDPETGEITTSTTGRFRQKKRDLRTGDLARMAAVMAGKKIDQLCFGGGDGVAMVRAIRDEARRPARKEETRAARIRKRADVGSPHRRTLRRTRPRKPGRFFELLNRL